MVLFMKDLFLDSFYAPLNKEIQKLKRIQTLGLCCLSMSRMWVPFAYWASSNNIPHIIDVGDKCSNMLWNQVITEQIYNTQYDLFLGYIREIKAEVNELYDQDISIDDSPARIYTDALSAAVCFFNPKMLLKGVKYNFIDCAEMIVGGISEYIYDEILSSNGNISEDELAILVKQSPIWQKECDRVKSDLALVASFPQNKEGMQNQRNIYRNINVFDVPL